MSLAETETNDGTVEQLEGKLSSILDMLSR